MGRGPLCEVCGNRISGPHSRCPFCNSELAEELPEQSGNRCRTVNLEKGMPLVDTALQRCRTELEMARLQGYGAVILIHGYGSSGRGGAIKKEVHRQLRYMVDQGQLAVMVPGEKLQKRSGPGRELLKRFPSIAGKGEQNLANPGITVVIL